MLWTANNSASESLSSDIVGENEYSTPRLCYKYCCLVFQWGWESILVGVISGSASISCVMPEKRRSILDLEPEDPGTRGFKDAKPWGLYCTAEINSIGDCTNATSSNWKLCLVRIAMHTERSIYCRYFKLSSDFFSPQSSRCCKTRLVQIKQEFVVT